MINDKNMLEKMLLNFIFLVLLMLSIYTPVGIVSFYILPIPFIIYGYRYSFGSTPWIIIITVIISLFIGSLFGIFLAFASSTIGIVMGILYKKGNAIQAVVGGVITAIINFILALIISNIIYGSHVEDLLQQMLLSSLESTEKIFVNLDNNLQMEQIINSYRNFFESIGRLLPFIFISYSLFIVWINHILVRQIMKIYRTKLPKFPPIREWVFPKSIVYYYVITVIIIMIKPDVDLLNLITVNLYPLLQLILMIQGVSFIFYYSFYKRLGKILPTITIISIFIPFLSQMIHFIGVIDLGFDLRKKLKSVGTD